MSSLGPLEQVSGFESKTTDSLRSPSTLARLSCCRNTVLNRRALRQVSSLRMGVGGSYFEVLSVSDPHNSILVLWAGSPPVLKCAGDHPQSKKGWTPSGRPEESIPKLVESRVASGLRQRSEHRGREW